MFAPRDITAGGDRSAANASPHGGVAMLSMAQAIDDPQRFTISRKHGFTDHAVAAKRRLWRRISLLDWTPDLAQNIGSARWFRGLGTMIALGGVALAFWPDFSPLEAAPAMEADDAVRDEFRSQMILPLALGADSGRHMGWSQNAIPLNTAPERPRVELVATLASGDSFERMLRRAGVGSAEAAEVNSLVSGAVPISEVPAGTKVAIVLGRRPSEGVARPIESLSFRARFDLELGLERRGGRLALNPRRIAVDNTPLRIRGTVGPGLYRSARAAGAPAEAVQQYLRALGSQVSGGFSSDDTYDIIVEYKRAATGESEVGKLIYAGLERGGKPKAQLLRWGSDGQFFEASGVGQTTAGLARPVSGRVSSGYGMRRHPILGYRRMHTGMDFKASYGTPIHAVTDGVVTYAARKGGYGNFVRINHGGGMATGYAHMSRFAVRSGTRVRRGQIIGYVGSTGLSTGPHLHYEVYRNNQRVNPAGFKFTTRSQLSGAQLEAFKARLARMKMIVPGGALQSIAPAEATPVVPVREIDRIDQPVKLN